MLEKILSSCLFSVLLDHSSNLDAVNIEAFARDEEHVVKLSSLGIVLTASTTSSIQTM
jgi:hypothetical protein